MRKQTILLLSPLACRSRRILTHSRCWQKKSLYALVLRQFLVMKQFWMAYSITEQHTRNGKRLPLSFDSSGLRHSETQRQDAFFQDYAESAVQVWRDEYKAFMRGKRPFEGNYAETEGNLYYTAADNDGFLIATLDKADKLLRKRSSLIRKKKKRPIITSIARTSWMVS